MTPDEYINNASRTNAPSEKAMDRFNNINHRALIDLLTEYRDICEKLDAVKKAVFYGKNFDQHQSFVGKFDYIVNNNNTKNMDIFHGIIGLATESGEMVDAFLKHLHGGELDSVNMAEELGDEEWYQHLLFKNLGTTMEAVWEKNIAKLRARYPEKFTEECAINRDIKAERKILEQ